MSSQHGVVYNGPDKSIFRYISTSTTLDECRRVSRTMTDRLARAIIYVPADLQHPNLAPCESTLAPHPYLHKRLPTRSKSTPQNAFLAFQVCEPVLRVVVLVFTPLVFTRHDGTFYCIWQPRTKITIGETCNIMSVRRDAQAVSFT